MQIYRKRDAMVIVNKKEVKQGFIFFFIALLLLCSSSLAVALEPPRAGEIKHLKQTGEFSERLEHAKALGNHLIDRELLERALYKAQRQALLQQSFPVDESVLPAPPPGWKGMPTTGNVKSFALLIDFNDYPHYNSRDSIHSALFGDGSLIPANLYPYESLKQYYLRSSYNQLNFSSGMTLGWYRPAYDRASMPMTSDARDNLIKEAITYFKGLGQDFSQFDNDGDGKIEYFIVIWTGPDNGWSNFWWGYQTNFSDQAFTVDGKTLGKYSWQWEYCVGCRQTFDPIVVMHETGHGLGLPDYYDYDPDVGPDGGVGGLDMMHGNWGDHNSFSKWVLEWLTPTVVATGSQSLMLSPSGKSKDAVLIMPGATFSDPFREFFIAQNRYRAGNDTGYPTDGMLIWHVDARLNSSATNYLYNNSFTAHKLLKLMQADGLDRIENNSAWADSAMYYAPGKTLTPTSNPSSKDYMGVDTRVNVTGISQAVQQMSATFSIDEVSTLATLNVTKPGTGSGTVTSASEGISCGDDCAQSYTPGTSVTLSAVPAPGVAFTGWSGDGCLGTGSCMVTMSSDMMVTANFETTVLLSENFDAEVLPSGWTTQITAGGYWWFDYPDYNNTGGNGGYALGAIYFAGPYDIELRTETFNTSSFDNIGLEFKTGISDSRSTADVDVSVNGSAGPWTNVWRKIGWFIGPQTVNVDLSSIAAGHSNIMLRFRTYGTWIWWAIDDVKVMALSTCPTAPTQLKAISTSASQVKLTWKDNSSDEASFKVYRKKDSGSWNLIATKGANVTSHTNWTAIGNTSTTTYSYYIQACNVNGCSPKTRTAVVPYRPTNLTATASSSSRINLAWTDNSGNETGFEIERKNGSCSCTNSWGKIATIGKDIKSYSNTGLSPGKTYSYRVRAYKKSSTTPYAYGYSLYSNCKSATTP